MDRSPRWRKPAGRLDQPARPRRVLAVIRVLVLLAARGRPFHEPARDDGGGNVGLPVVPHFSPPPAPPPHTPPPPNPPAGGGGGGFGGPPPPPFPPRRPPRGEEGGDPPADGSAASQPGQPGLVDFLVAWFGGVGQPWGAQGALGGGRHGGMQPTCSATRNGASVVSPIRCRRLRAAIGAQRKAHRLPIPSCIGKRCNAAMRFDGQRR